MLEWAKEALHKKCQTQNDHSDDTQLLHNIDAMRGHFLKLCSYLIRYKDSGQKDPCILNFANFQIPRVDVPKITQKEHVRMMGLLYWRLKIILANLQDQFNLNQDLNDIFHHVKDSDQPTVTSFFALCCYRMIEEINDIHKNKQLKKYAPKSQVISLPQKKLSFQEISSHACSTIYDILELERIQACYLQIKGLNLIQNVNFIYDRQKTKNKKVNKLYSEYLLQYSNWAKQGRKKLVSVLRKKSYSGDVWWRSKPQVGRNENLRTKISSHSSSGSKPTWKALVPKERVKLEPIKKRSKLTLNK